MLRVRFQLVPSTAVGVKEWRGGRPFLRSNQALSRYRTIDEVPLGIYVQYHVGRVYMRPGRDVAIWLCSELHRNWPMQSSKNSPHLLGTRGRGRSEHWLWFYES